MVAHHPAHRNVRAWEIARSNPQKTSLINGEIPLAKWIDTDAFELSVLIIAGMVGGALLGSHSTLVDFANILVPAAIMISMAWGNLRMIRRKIEVVVTPYFAMRTAIFFYAGFGALAPIFSNEASQNVLQGFFSFTSNDLLKYNLINVVFILTIIIWPVVMGRIFTADRKSSADISFGIVRSNFSMGVIGLVFLISGELVRLIFTLPQSFGLAESTGSVIIAQFALAENIGIFLCLVAALKYDNKYVVPMLAFTLWVTATGLLTFSKTEVMLPLIMVALAFVYNRPSAKNLILSAIAILFIFNFLQPLVTYGRGGTIACCGEIEAPMSPAQRWQIVQEYFRSDGSNDGEDDEVNYAVIRLSYVNAGTFVISQYDAGQPGDSFSSSYLAFIPRFIWPDKPITTDVGRELGFAINGNANSAVSPGLTPEAYWNGGWLGVVFMGMAVGTILWVWSIYSLKVQQVGAWHLFVIVLLGIRVGIRFDGLFSLDFLASIPFALVGHAIIAVLNKFLLQRSGV